MNFKLGKLAAKKDERTLRLADVMAPKPIIPDAYDFDAGKSVPTPMFLNDQYGCCVMAGRAHQTLRFELTEQNQIIAVQDGDVLREYMSETGGQDSGLVVLDSLKEWQQNGWQAAAHRYNIHSFLAVNPQDQHEVMAAIYLMSGTGIGVQLPQSAMDQFQAGEPWTVQPDDGGIIGGHYVYLPAYNSTGPICVTWGQRQQMTWEWFAAYCDEAFAIAQSREPFVCNSPIDVGKLDMLLEEVQAA